MKGGMYGCGGPCLNEDMKGRVGGPGGGGV